MVSKIQKRDGGIVKFNAAKITNAIHKAVSAVGARNGKLAQELSREIVRIVDERFPAKIPSVEDIQDIVEDVLIRKGYSDVAKAYILYRQKRTELREAKKILGVRDDLKLSINAVRVLERRYLRKDENREVIETPSEMFRRVAKAISAVDSKYGKNKRQVKGLENEFYEMMSNLEFLPNSPTLMNAGTDIGQLSACFVLPIEDSMESIFESVKNMALIHQSGGGTGFSFSKLRPNGDIVRSTGGIASGPVSFMRVFDIATEVIKQGGRRRGANMGTLRVDHPDILEFIIAKEKEGVFKNFNISVAVTDRFMKAVKENKKYILTNPRTGKYAKKLNARGVFDLMVAMAWRTGDPGMVFLDEIDRLNPTPQLGEIESTNPCGEVPLLPYESCNLGSINLSKMIKNGEIDWNKLRRTIRKSVHFLDNVIDANRFPLPEIEKATKGNRKIGLGVMGFAELLIQLNIAYNSKRALSTAERIMKFITEEARKKSIELAEERGSFPNFRRSIWKKKFKQMRNATLTSIAPTGSISIIADCSSGIEPLFAVSFVRNVMMGTKLLEVNKFFEKAAREKGFYSEELMMRIAEKGSIQDMEEIPKGIRKIFVTALDIEPEWHVRMQAAFQKYTDNAVSKTVNLRRDATTGDVRRVFLLAHKLKCKGITVYRYGSKREQVLYIGTLPGKPEERYTTAESEFAGGCPVPYCPG